jgi:beta-glucosidase
MLNLKALIQDLTLEEKITLISGFDSWHTHKIERLNIPSIKMSDGPNGVRGNGLGT